MDYETFPDPKQIVSVLTVSEVGQTNRSVNATLWVILQDVNDNSPVFPSEVRLSAYNSGMGRAIVSKFLGKLQGAPGK